MAEGPHSIKHRSALEAEWSRDWLAMPHDARPPYRDWIDGLHASSSWDRAVLMDSVEDIKAVVADEARRIVSAVRSWFGGRS